MEIKPSETNREFATGAVRGEDKGRGKPSLLPAQAMSLIAGCFPSVVHMPWAAILQLARVYEGGMRKYSARNWEKGMPLSAFVDSAVRHLGKHCMGRVDEPHLTQYVWNLVCALQMALWVQEGERPYSLYEVEGDPQFISLNRVDLGDDFAATTNIYVGVVADDVPTYVTKSYLALNAWIDGQGNRFLVEAAAWSLVALNKAGGYEIE